MLDSILSTLLIFSFANASKTLGYKTFLSVDKGIVGKKKSKVECCWFLTVSTLFDEYIKKFLEVARPTMLRLLCGRVRRPTFNMIEMVNQMGARYF